MKKKNRNQLNQMSAKELEDAKAQERKKRLSKLPEESFAQWVIRLIKLTKWSVLLGIPGAIAACFALYYYLVPFITPKSQVLESDIKEKIEEIQRTINPKDLENDTCRYAAFLRKYQETVLDYCSMWKSLNQSKPLSIYFENDEVDLDVLVDTEMDRVKALIGKLSDVNMQIRRILQYEEFTDTTYLTKINHPALLEVENALKEWHEEDSLLSIEINGYNESAKMKKGSALKKDVKKMIELLDEKKNGVKKLHAESKWLDFMIDCNAMFKISLRNYAKIPPYMFARSLHRNDTTYLSDDFLDMMIDYYIEKRREKEVKENL